MSIYICNECEGMHDKDYVGCEADPRDDTALLCLDCFESVDYEYTAKIEGVQNERV